VRKNAADNPRTKKAVMAKPDQNRARAVSARELADMAATSAMASRFASMARLRFLSWAGK
jgi:hypothetical protein